MDLDLEKRLQGDMLGNQVDTSPGVGPLTIASDDVESELTQMSLYTQSGAGADFRSPGLDPKNWSTAKKIVGLL